MAVAKGATDYKVSEMVIEDSAIVYGVVLDVSPIKSSRNNPSVKYFSARITDGKKCARMISFEPKLRPSLETYQVEGSTVALVNCRIKPGKYDPALEIMASHNTEVTCTSPKKFKLDLSLQPKMDHLKSLEEIHGLCGGEKNKKGREENKRGGEETDPPVGNGHLTSA